MEIEAVDPSSWCQEDTALLVKVIAHIHQNLNNKRISERSVIIVTITLYYTVLLLLFGYLE